MIKEGWFDMNTAPRDGTIFDLLVKSKDGVPVIVHNIKYGHAPMDKSKLILWGNQNFLSIHLEPLGWRPLTTKGEVKVFDEPLVNKKKPIDPSVPKPYVDKFKRPWPI